MAVGDITGFGIGDTSTRAQWHIDKAHQTAGHALRCLHRRRGVNAAIGNVGPACTTHQAADFITGTPDMTKRKGNITDGCLIRVTEQTADRICRSDLNCLIQTVDGVALPIKMTGKRVI